MNISKKRNLIGDYFQSKRLNNNSNNSTPSFKKRTNFSTVCELYFIIGGWRSSVQYSYGMIHIFGCSFPRFPTLSIHIYRLSLYILFPKITMAFIKSHITINISLHLIVCLKLE